MTTEVDLGKLDRDLLMLLQELDDLAPDDLANLFVEHGTSEIGYMADAPNPSTKKLPKKNTSPKSLPTSDDFEAIGIEILQKKCATAMHWKKRDYSKYFLQTFGCYPCVAARLWENLHRCLFITPGQHQPNELLMALFKMAQCMSDDAGSELFAVPADGTFGQLAWTLIRKVSALSFKYIYLSGASEKWTSDLESDFDYLEESGIELIRIRGPCEAMSKLVLDGRDDNEDESYVIVEPEMVESIQYSVGTIHADCGYRVEFALDVFSDKLVWVKTHPDSTPNKGEDRDDVEAVKTMALVGRQKALADRLKSWSIFTQPCVDSEDNFKDAIMFVFLVWQYQIEMGIY